MTIDGFRGRQVLPGSKSATLSLINCKNVLIRGCQASPGTGFFLGLEGKETADVAVIGNDLANAERGLRVANEVSAETVYLTANRLA